MRLVLLSMLVLGCATPNPKMSWAEAMGSPQSERQAQVPSLKSDPLFEAALRAFIDAAQAARKAAAPGAPMPVAQAAAWVKLLADVDAFLKRPARQTSMLDLARARVVVESELEFDGTAYGDIAPVTAATAQATVQRLTARLNELLQVAKRPKVTPSLFAWPVRPVLVSSPFGGRVHPLTGAWRLHRGVDVVADLGQPVKAAFAGTVVFAGWNGAHGKTVHLVHDAHWSTRYSHLSAWEVEPGTTVAKGEIIGYAGSTGQSTGPHVHFELLQEGVPVDPETELPEPTDGRFPLAVR